MSNYTGIRPEQFWSLYYDTGGLYILNGHTVKHMSLKQACCRVVVMRLAKAWNRNAKNIKGMLHAHGSACMIGAVIGVLSSWINHE